MTNKFVLLVVTIFFIGMSVKAQDCFKYFPQKVGVAYETKQYDKKDKLTETTVKTVTKKIENDTLQQVDYKIESQSPDSDSVYITKYSVVCEDGIMYFDMESYLNQEQLSAYEGMDIEIDADKIDYPSNPKVGQQLKNGSVKATVKNQGMTIFTLTVSITNRKIEAIEKITTDAGTFDCVKLTYDATTVMGFLTIKSKGIEWIAEGVGNVRSENYNKKDKLVSYSVLTKITNP